VKGLSALGGLLFALSLRHHQKKWGRFLLTFTGVVIAVAVSSAIRTTNDRVIDSFSSTLTSLSGKANLQLTQEGGLDPEQLWGLDFLWKSGWFTPFIKITGTFEGEPVQLYGFDFLADQQIRQLGTTAPNQEEPPAGLWLPPDSPLLSSGKQVELVIGAKKISLPIAGTLKTINGSLPPRGTGFIDLDELKPLNPRVSGLDIWVESGSLDRVRDQLKAKFPAAQVIELSKKQQFTTDMLKAFQMNLGALGLVALLVSCYLVYNSLNLAVLERQTDLNVLVALGAKPKQLFQVLLIEGVLFGVFGGLVGAALGWVMSRFSFSEVSQTVSQVFYLPVGPSGETSLEGPLISLGLGVFACVFAAWFPARRATALSTADGLKARVEVFEPAKALRVGVLGLLFLVVSGGLVLYGLKAHQVWPGFGAIFLSLLGLSFLAPLLLFQFAWLFRRAEGLGLLLRASVLTHLFKLSVAIAALTVALSMAGSISVMVHSFRATFGEWLDLTVQADLYVKSHSKGEALVGQVPPELEAKILTLSAVRNSIPIYLSQAYLDDRAIDLRASDLGDKDFQEMIHLVEHLENPYQQLQQAPGVLICEVLSEKTGLQAGDSMELLGQKMLIVGVFQNFSSQKGLAYLDTQVYKRAFPYTAPNGVGIFLNPGVNHEQALLDLRAVTGQWSLDFQISEQIKQRGLQIFDQTFRLTRLLQTVAFGISLLAVISTLSTLVVERKGEFAVLLSLGASPVKLQLSLLAESLGLAVVALFLSGFGALALSWVLIEVINKFSFGWTIYTEIPWGDLFQIGGLIVLAAGLAAWVPARMIGRLNLAKILKAEG